MKGSNNYELISWNLDFNIFEVIDASSLYMN